MKLFGIAIIIMGIIVFVVVVATFGLPTDTSCCGLCSFLPGLVVLGIAVRYRHARSL